jgi:hypothetical protein
MVHYISFKAPTCGFDTFIPGSACVVGGIQMDNSRGVGMSRDGENLREIISNFGPVLEIIKPIEGRPAAGGSSEVLVLLEKEETDECECARRVEVHSFPPAHLRVQVEEKTRGIHLVKKEEF